MKQAVYIGRGGPFRGNAVIYRLNPPYKTYEYVVVSTVQDSWVDETMLFGCDAFGNPDDWDSLAEIAPAGTPVECLARIGYAAEKRV